MCRMQNKLCSRWRSHLIWL